MTDPKKNNKLNQKQIIALFASLFVVGGIATWFFFVKKQTATLPLLVPSNAICLLKVDQPSTYLDTLYHNSLLNSVRSIPYVDDNVKRGKVLQKYLKPNLSWLNQNAVFASLHVKSREELGTLFYIILEGNDFNKMKGLLKSIQKDPNLVITTRKYKKSKIVDITHRKTGEQLSYVLKGNIWVGSMSPVLVEDAIQHYNAQQENAFVQKYQEAISKPSNKMQLCFNFAQFHTLNKYLRSQDPTHTSLIEKVESAQMDLTLSDQRLLLNGWVNPNTPNWASIWKGQEAQVFYLKSFLPNNAATFDRISISNEALFFKNLKNFLKTDSLLPAPPAIINLPQLESQIDKEILQTRLEEEAQQTDKLLLLKVKDADQTINLLQKWASKASSNHFNETYKGHQTFELRVGNLPAMLLGSSFLGYDNCFVTKVAPDVVVLANNYKSLQTYIVKLQKDEVWAKSVKLNDVLNQVSEKQNWTSFVQPSKAWKIIEHHASPLWKNYMKQYGLLFKGVKFVAFQANAGRKNRVWLTLDLSLASSGTKTNPKEQDQDSDWNTELKVSISQKAATQPFVVINHKNKNKELLIQDRRNALKLLTLKGKQLWSAKLDSKITSPVYQIDYYKNGKLQYLFTTERSLYLVDRNGNRVDHFPMKLGTDINRLNALALFDYDQNKDYRLWLSDTHGKVRLLNKKGKTPNGWKLNKLSYRSSHPAQYVRIKDRDFILLVQDDGKVLIVNRRGEPIKGFPIDLNTKTTNDFFVQKGSNVNNSTMTLLSDSGELINITFAGKVRKKQLIKPETTTEFRLIRSTDQSHFCILRQHLGVVEILDHEGNTLFETNFATGGPKEAQFFYYDASTWFVAITDLEGGFAYVFNADGSLIGKPIQSDQQIYLDYNDRQSLISVYTVHDKSLLKKTFKVR